MFVVTAGLGLVGGDVELQVLVHGTVDELTHRGAVGAGHLDRGGVEGGQSFQI